MKNGMNIRQCYTVLELPMRSPLEEVKQSYKDLVQVWHPDRFTHSPRLQEKAAHKLLQLNEAYDTLKQHLERQSVQGAYGYGSANYGSASYGSANYGTASYGSTGYEAASRAGAAQDWGTGSSTATEDEAASYARTRTQQAAIPRNMPSFFDSGSSYSLTWQLKATGVIFGFMSLMLVPIGLAVLIAEHPLLILLLIPLPVMAYVYRVWVTR